MEYEWSFRSPIVARAMLLANDRLFLGGVKDPERTGIRGLKALEDSAGGFLLVIDANNGNQMARYQLDAIPAFDGIIAAYDHLFIAMDNGNVVCWNKL
jgi:hypothetical protein